MHLLRKLNEKSFKTDIVENRDISQLFNLLQAAISDLRNIVLENVAVEYLQILLAPENPYETILNEIEKTDFQIDSK